LIARAISEEIHPRALLTGEDLCSQRGPLVSPKYLRQEYFPLLEYALEPLLEQDAKVVWHCDGDVRLLLDDILACGIGGLQGFQRECGMDLEWIADLRTRDGEPLVIFGPISVTETMPHGSTDDVRAAVRWAMETCRDRASLLFFTSNTITPDVPLENVRTLWETILDSQW
jgi:uroporphyrinogen decarboxylase